MDYALIQFFIGIISALTIPLVIYLIIFFLKSFLD